MVEAHDEEKCWIEPLVCIGIHPCTCHTDMRRLRMMNAYMWAKGGRISIRKRGGEKSEKGYTSTDGEIHKQRRR